MTIKRYKIPKDGHSTSLPVGTYPFPFDVELEGLILYFNNLALVLNNGDEFSVQEFKNGAKVIQTEGLTIRVWPAKKENRNG
jgi:hypothetical protein